MRRIILALCLLLAVGATLAGTEEIVPKEKPKPAETTEAKADGKTDPKAEAKADGDAEACRETFNTLEDIYGADKEALAKHLAALKAAEAGEKDTPKPATAVEWKEVPEDKPTP